MKIKTSKHVLIRSGQKAEDAPLIWTADINNIVFTPDAVRVKTVSMDGFIDGVNYEIRTDIIDPNSPLTVVQDALNVFSVNIEHILKRAIQGRYNFTMFDPIGAQALAPVNNTNIMIHLEFIQYE